MHKYNYNYKITNTITKEFYIGVRSCDCEIEEDKYMGSSSVWTKLYVKEHKKVLIKEILAVFSTRKEANDNEVILLQEVKDDPLCINKYFDYTPDLTGTKQTPEWIEKRKMFGEKNGMFGKHHTEEVKKKISEKLKGRKLSEETKKKIGDFHRGKIVSQETRELQSRIQSKIWTIVDLSTNEIFVGILSDFCKLHEEENFKTDTIRKAAKNGNIFHKRYKIYKGAAFTENSNRKSDENGEPLEVDNPVGSSGSAESTENL
jgi:hypothetical protein